MAAEQLHILFVGRRHGMLYLGSYSIIKMLQEQKVASFIDPRTAEAYYCVSREPVDGILIFPYKYSSEELKDIKRRMSNLAPETPSFVLESPVTDAQTQEMLDIMRSIRNRPDNSLGAKLKRFLSNISPLSNPRYDFW